MISPKAKAKDLLKRFRQHKNTPFLLLYHQGRFQCVELGSEKAQPWETDPFLLAQCAVGVYNHRVREAQLSGDIAWAVEQAGVITAKSTKDNE